MTKTPNQLKHRAALLLRKYDKARADLRKLEAVLNEACRDWGRTQGFGERYNHDQMRTRLLVEQEQKIKTERKAA